MRGVLCLFEGVVTGAADGYGRVAGRPAATLLHLGPGLGNGLANLHNARRARTPHRQHRRRPRDLPRPLRRAPPVGYRVHRRARCRGGTARRHGPTTWRPTPPTRWPRRYGPPGLRGHAGPAGRRVLVGVGAPAPARPGLGGRAAVVPARHGRRGGQGPALGRAGGAAARAAAPCGPAALHAASRVATHDGSRAAGRDVSGQPRARGGRPGRGAAGLSGRDGPGPAGRCPPPRPGGRQVARVLLRLSRQGQRPGPARLHRAHPGPARARTRPAPSRPWPKPWALRATPLCRPPAVPARAPAGAITTRDPGRRRRGHPARGRDRGRRGQHLGPLRRRRRRRARRGTTG